MTDEELGQELRLLGMDAASYRALALLPLVQVAWADGAVQDAERDLILDLADRHYALGEDGKRLLRNWLHHPPSAGYAQRGRHVLVELCDRDGFEALDKNALGDVISLAKQVARSAGGFFGFGAISPSEAEAIEQIARALDISSARRWVSADDETSIPEDADLENDGPDVEIVFHPVPDAGPVVGHLVLYDEDRGDRACPITEHGITIGRGTSSTVQINYDAQVSRAHCRVHAERDRIYVEDLHSVSGTWVNGERVLSRRLFGGEQVAVGATMFFVQLV